QDIAVTVTAYPNQMVRLFQEAEAAIALGETLVVIAVLKKGFTFLG
ncbi:TPA: hypothetical protein TUD09_001718, partial [Streptococcus equi subsp. zooepidemicus]